MMTAPVKIITATTFYHRYREGSEKLHILDLRTHAEVETECLQGTGHFPVQSIDYQQVRAYLDKQNHQAGQPVYLLCAGGPRATLAAEKLKDDIEADLIIIEGGLNALKNQGLEITRGNSKVISLERQVRIAAGSLVSVGILLGVLVNPWFFGLSAFVGAGLVFAGVTDTCGMGMILAHMPWNNERPAA
jgi:rhodanese-related sulfurtransferase|tara:strand:- start:151 stop:717 length:567 start_codon:yes stop_codon:yes gene_type:complete